MSKGRLLQGRDCHILKLVRSTLDHKRGSQPSLPLKFLVLHACASVHLTPAAGPPETEGDGKGERQLESPSQVLAPNPLMAELALPLGLCSDNGSSALFLRS